MRLRCLVLAALVSNVSCIYFAAFRFDVTEVRVSERDGVARIKIVKKGKYSIQAIVSYRARHISTTDSDIQLGDGIEGDIKFNLAETEKFLEIPFIDDEVDTSFGEAKMFFVQIIAVTTLPESPPGIFAISVEPRKAIVYIEDDDVKDEGGTEGGEIVETRLDEEAKLTIACNDNFIEVSFKKQDYPTAELDTAHLEHASCKPRFVEEDIVIFQFGLQMCGTVRTYSSEDGHLEYNNAVKMIVGAIADFPDKNSSFSRRHWVVFPFKCSYKKKALVTATVSFNPRSTEFITSAADYGNFTFFMNMYKSKRYEEVESYPVIKRIGQQMYLELKVESGDAQLVVFPDWCRTSIHQEHEVGPYHWIMENTCPVDNTLVYDYSINATQRFSLAAFQYKDSIDDVYIHCQATVCRMENIMMSRCAEGCTHDRGKSRRDTTDEMNALLFVGPIHFVHQTNTEVGGSSPSSNGSGVSDFTLVLIIIGFLTFLALVLIVCLVLIIKCRRSSNAYLTIQEKELLEIQGAAIHCRSL